ncbi:hypothetical protein BU15DRAFT_77436 [Melanogaster broomeanus]|nr:hypothetical protein BU15DRAFT_77436 [Melanogaster broomeanus]
MTYTTSRYQVVRRLPMFTPNNHEPNGSEEISDQEWEIRTVVFFTVRIRLFGLVSNVDPTSPDIVNVSPSESEDIESIYNPTIRLTYTPPVALPSPFPRTLSLEGDYFQSNQLVITPEFGPGLPLYMASSVFIRHTMKTLYSDLRVELRKFAVQSSSTPPNTDHSCCSDAWIP